MKAIILAGGSGSRLYPITQVMTKQLMPVYDKPMIYYPLSQLMLGGIREVLLITRPQDQEAFQSLLKDGSHLGMNIQYKVQHQPKGLPEAFTLGQEFIGGTSVTMILGDNLFYGDLTWFRDSLEEFNSGRTAGGQIFGYHVADPRSYGVVEMNEKTGQVISLEEKPENPKSNLAIPGLYIFDNTVAKRAHQLKPSPRGETEITDLMKSYYNDGQLKARRIGRGVAWLDTGTPKSLVDASTYIAAIEERQNLKVACLEEIAVRMGFIDNNQFEACIEALPNCSYRDYLKGLMPIPVKNSELS